MAVRLSHCQLLPQIETKGAQDSTASNDVLIGTAISSWEQVIKRVAILCFSCSEEQLLVEVAPGRNRILYLWGHLIAVNDAMFSVLRLGVRLHPELDAVFIAQPDRSVPLPTSVEIAKGWEDVHTELLSRFKTLSSEEWLDRHGNVSPEEFERNPTRNRLAVLLGRTNHASYHLGQMILAKPKTP
jgi:uncharacterized damage-inducible protein DinB